MDKFKFFTAIIFCALLFSLSGNALAQVYWAKTYAYGAYSVDSVGSVRQTSDGGFVVAGSTDKGIDDYDFWVLKLDISGNVQWQKTYGGDSFDYAFSIAQTIDGGYIVIGATDSFDPDGWGYDYWFLKLDAGGNILWQKIYEKPGSGNGWGNPTSVHATADGGCIVAGDTFQDVDSGEYAFWVLKLDALGDIQWQKHYGGSYNGDGAYSIDATSDGGYIVAGYRYAEGWDYWLLKLDSSGNIEWQKTYGGSSYDIARSVQQTSDSGYIVAGYTESFGAGEWDFWVLKLDSDGNIEWQKTYGSFDAEWAASVQQALDGGFIVAGTKVNGSRSDPWCDCDCTSCPAYDYWILKLDSFGNIEWQKTYGGADNEYARSAQQTSDGGYIVAGVTGSFGTGHDNIWILKLDADGNIDDSCDFIGDTFITGADSSATVSDTAVTPIDSTAIPADTAATVADSSASVMEQCARTCAGIVLSAPPQASVDFQSCGGSIATSDLTPTLKWSDVSNESGYAWEVWTKAGCAGTRVASGITGANITTADVSPALTPGTYYWRVKASGDGITYCDSDWTCECPFTVECLPAPSQISVDFQPCGSSITTSDPTPTLEWSDVSNESGYVWEVWTGSGCTGLKSGRGTTGANITTADVSPALVDGTYYWRVKASGDGITYCDSAWTCGCPFAVSGGGVVSAYWARTYGGSGDDIAYAVRQTSDGGFVVAGYTDSFGAGSEDFWILKLGAIGNIEWQKTYGGNSYDIARSIEQTSDGGFVVAGWTYSGGSVTDYWVLKLDSLGNVEWQKIYAGISWDFAYAIQQTEDGGYIVAGYSYPCDICVPDSWILKLDSAGNIEWQKIYGGSSDDRAYAVQQTSDGGYIVAGYTNSFGAGYADFWVLKLDSSGNIQWQKTYGGSSDDRAYAVQQTGDGGYIVAGYTKSFGAGNWDYWVLKLDSSGNIQWQKTYGGNDYEEARYIQQTSDGGFVVAGDTWSFGSDYNNFWVLKLDALGNVQWQKTYGGASNNSAYSIQQTYDDGYIVAGYTRAFGAGGSDFWVLKLKPSGEIDGINDECDFVRDTAVAPGTSTANVSDTNINPVNSSAAVSDTSVSVANTSAIMGMHCWGCVPLTDMNCNGCVDELIDFSYSFGSFFGDSWHNSDADFNGDGAVDGMDLSVFINDFGLGCFP